jgi:hypothetical protein
VFEEWGIPRVAPNDWSGTGSWFDEHHGELLSQVFTGFYARWSDSRWRRTMETALYWYVCANDRGATLGADAALVLAQNALECLAWTYCAQERRPDSERALKRPPRTAADKICMLASGLDVPVDLPARMTHFRGCRGQPFSDIPHAITFVRNGLVHPEGNELLEAELYYEAWRSAMWLLDLVLLRLCRHSGGYVNRLDDRRCAGELTAVPWSDEDCG